VDHLADGSIVPGELGKLLIPYNSRGAYQISTVSCLNYRSEGNVPYWALKSLWSLTNKSASALTAGADDSAGAAEDGEVALALSEAASEEVGSREAEADGSGAKIPVLIEVVSAEEADADADAELAADSMEMLVEAEAVTVVETEAEGRAQALFLATGDARAGAARARTGRTESRVENIIVIVGCVFDIRKT
jgi:hypothetical protein